MDQNTAPRIPKEVDKAGLSIMKGLQATCPFVERKGVSQRGMGSKHVRDKRGEACIIITNG